MNRKNFYTITTFSLSRKIKSLDNIIAFSHYTEELFSLEENKRRILKNLYSLGIKDFIIYEIEDNDIEYESKFYTDPTAGINTNNTLYHFKMSFKKFIERRIATKVNLDEKIKKYDSIFIFKNITYRELALKLREVDIIVSGGSIVKRHILSPLQFRLVIFLLAIYGFEEEKIIKSFHSSYIETLNKKVGIDLTSKTIEKFFKEKKEKQLEANKEINNKLEFNKNITENKYKPKLRKSSIDSLVNQKREYHKNNLNLYNSKIEESPIFNYLDIIETIIKMSNNNVIEAQRKIELEWYNFMKVKLDDSKVGIRSNFGSIINKAKITLELKDKKGYLKRKFPLIDQKLNDINILLITFAIILNFMNIRSFTSIAITIFKEIFIYLYINENKIYDPILYKNYIKRLGYENIEDQINFGSYFIEIFSEYPNKVFERKYKDNYNYDSDFDTAILVINDEYYDIIKNNIIVQPTSLPMICKPLE
jgi:hypothetical protein